MVAHAGIGLSRVRSKQDVALRKIIKKIRETGPVKRSDFLDMPNATYYDNQRRAIELGIAKKLDDGRLAWIEHKSLEEQIYKIFTAREGNEKVEIELIARYVGEPPDGEEFKKAYWAALKKVHRTDIRQKLGMEKTRRTD